jgi:LacI family transcriptional regulator
MRRLHLEDLSKELGFSKTLISMVLNGKGNQYGISKTTQAKVLDAIEKFKYTPSRFGKALRTVKSNIIGLIVSDIGNPFYSAVAKTIENVMFGRGYHLMVCSSDESEEKEKLLVNMLVNQQGVDGIIIASTLKSPSFYDEPRLMKMPIVFIDRVVPMFNANYVVTDNYRASFEIVSHLINEGCRSISCMAMSPAHLSTMEDRLNGYRMAITRSGLDIEGTVMRIGYRTISEDAEKHLRQFIELNERPDAIFVLCNQMAVTVLGLLKKKEFSRLKNVRIACFDDLEIFDLVDRKILSVSQPVQEIGMSASTLILDLISGKENNKQTKVLSTTMVVR